MRAWPANGNRKDGFLPLNGLGTHLPDPYSVGGRAWGAAHRQPGGAAGRVAAAPGAREQKRGAPKIKEWPRPPHHLLTPLPSRVSTNLAPGGTLVDGGGHVGVFWWGGEREGQVGRSQEKRAVSKSRGRARGPAHSSVRPISVSPRSFSHSLSCARSSSRPPPPWRPSPPAWPRSRPSWSASPRSTRGNTRPTKNTRVPFRWRAGR